MKKEQVNENLLIDRIFEHLPQYIFWKDKNSVYLGCNENYATLIGLSKPKEIIGKTDHDIGWLPSGDSPELFTQGDKKIISGERIINQKERLSLPNKNILVLVNKVPLTDQNNNTIGVLGVATDITEKEKLESELRSTRAQLDGVTLASASIAHEMRTPLAAINACSDIALRLHKKINNTKYQRLAEIFQLIKSNAKHANHIIDMIIKNISLQEGKELRLEQHQMSDIVSKALDDYPSSDTEKRKITFRQENDFPILADNKLIQQLLFNLMKNSFYFIQKCGRGEIKIYMSHSQNTNRLHFEDTAQGISKEAIHKIFDRFFTEGTDHGTGIGLPFCKFVMEKHNGIIYCKSEYGKYTHFILEFPIQS